MSTNYPPPGGYSGGQRPEAYPAPGYGYPPPQQPTYLQPPGAFPHGPRPEAYPAHGYGHPPAGQPVPGYLPRAGHSTGKASRPASVVAATVLAFAMGVAQLAEVRLYVDIMARTGNPLALAQFLVCLFGALFMFIGGSRLISGNSSQGLVVSSLILVFANLIFLVYVLAANGGVIIIAIALVSSLVPAVIVVLLMLQPSKRFFHARGGATF